MSIEELKQRFIDGSLGRDIYTSTNEKGQTVVLNVSSGGFVISTYQDNGWVRENRYIYDGDLWTEEEIYEK